jgi:hypothetical protein
MKLNLFGGVFVFEGTYAEYTKLLANVDKLGNKLVNIQSNLNRDTIKTQIDLQKENPSVGMRTTINQRPAGLQ